MGSDRMKGKIGARAAMAVSLLGVGVLVSGCMGSPTYGTDKSANAQLTSDLASMFSLKPKGGAVSEYKPRPELVKPASLAALPAPQENVTSIANPEWPESPEQKRARLRAEATANQDNPFYESAIVNDVSGKSRGELDKLTPSQRQDEDAKPMTSHQSRATREEFNRRLAESKQGSPTNRKYLSEPPLEYRAAAATAATDDIGEDEDKKARRLKRGAKKSGGWRDLVPWL